MSVADLNFNNLDWTDYLANPSDPTDLRGFYNWKNETLFYDLEHNSPPYDKVFPWELKTLPLWKPQSKTPSQKLYHYALFLHYRKVMFPSTPTFRLFRSSEANDARIQEWLSIRNEVFGEDSFNTKEALKILKLGGTKVFFSPSSQRFLRVLLVEERSVIPGWREI